MNPEIAYLTRANAPRLAYRHRPGAAPTFVYLPGYYVPGLASDMEGAKPHALDQWAAAGKRACLRFDYRGCGASEGDFLDGTIGHWTTDALHVIDAAAPGPVVLVGSSLGGWTALLAARALGNRAVALLLLAPAPTRAGWLIDRARATVASADNAPARADLDTALALDPSDPTAHLLSAALARRAGDLPRARRDIAEARRLAPADADVKAEATRIDTAALATPAARAARDLGTTPRPY